MQRSYQDNLHTHLYVQPCLSCTFTVAGQNIPKQTSGLLQPGLARLWYVAGSALFEPFGQFLKTVQTLALTQTTTKSLEIKTLSSACSAYLTRFCLLEIIFWKKKKTFMQKEIKGCFFIYLIWLETLHSIPVLYSSGRDTLAHCLLRHFAEEIEK